MKLKKIRSATDKLRDIMNWLAVFKTEYDLPREAYRTLLKEVQKIGKAMDGIECRQGHVLADSMKPVADELRNTKNWLAVFKTEYGLPREAVKKLHAELDAFGKKLSQIRCK
ncbi:hypothetical protein D6825_01810 [Candidatus Woesearchaeota archaeon]|nr:MAG: hypothetical protein D6825_01810 [Candidatus Woesearchaeota archaeon]